MTKQAFVVPVDPRKQVLEFDERASPDLSEDLAARLAVPERDLEDVSAEGGRRWVCRRIGSLGYRDEPIVGEVGHLDDRAGGGVEIVDVHDLEKKEGRESDTCSRAGENVDTDLTDEVAVL